MMKKIYLYLFAMLGSGLLLSSCTDFLNVDKYFTDRMTEQKMFENKDYTNRWLAGVYSHLTECRDMGDQGSVVFNYSDDMYFSDNRDPNYATFKYGQYNEGSVQSSWGRSYIGIRDATTFIRYVDINKELTYKEIQDYKSQARFLRAYYHWHLLRKYGPIPLLKEEADYIASYEDLAIPRSTYDECVAYIADELALAAIDLPLDRTTREITRPTRGAALGLRAKVLLYGASPLANPRPSDTERFTDLVDDKGTHLISQVYNEEKWARAAAAAKDVINLNKYELYVAPKRDRDAGREYPKTVIPPHDYEYSDKNWPDGWADIDPFESYRSLFNAELQLYANPELIYTRGQNLNIKNILWNQVPFSIGGRNCNGLTQKQCDSYYMDNGADIPGMHDYMEADYPDRNTLPRTIGFIDANNKDQFRRPLEEGVYLGYANREPRFYASVAYNGSTWEMTSSEKPEDRFMQGWYYSDKPDGIQTVNPELWLRTGVGIKKFYNPIESYRKGREFVKPDLAMRYPEILLIYAEALNELEGTYSIPSWNGEQVYTVKRDTPEMKNTIKPIRIRAGLPNYTQTIYDDAKLLRKSLKRERQIELLAEGHRYYDLRRWKDAPMEEATPVYGCNMYLGSEMRDEFYRPTIVPSMPTVFVKKMYFWPISHGELKKNSRLTQNPGWTYYD